MAMKEWDWNTDNQNDNMSKALKQHYHHNNFMIVNFKERRKLLLTMYFFKTQSPTLYFHTNIDYHTVNVYTVKWLTLYTTIKKIIIV